MDTSGAAKKLLRQLNIIHHQKIKKLKAQILAGDYNIDQKEVAKVLLMTRPITPQKKSQR